MVVKGDLAKPRARAGCQLDENVHLARVRSRMQLRGDVGLVEAIFAKRFAEALERRVQALLPENFTGVEAQRNQRLPFGGRFAQSLDADQVDKEILANDEIQAHAPRRWRSFRAQIGVAAGAIQRAQACADDLRIGRLAHQPGEIGGIFFEHGPLFGNDPDGGDPLRIQGCGCLRPGNLLRAGRRGEKTHYGANPKQRHKCASVLSHASSSSDGRLAQPRCLLRRFWRYDEQGMHADGCSR